MALERAREGPCYSQKARVRDEAVWVSQLEKERAVFRKGGVPAFQMDLANGRMETVTEKEIKQSPQARRTLKGIDSGSLEVQAIKHLARRPTDKWDIPLTSAQEQGWLLGNPVRADTINTDPGLNRKVPQGGRDRLPGMKRQPGDPAGMWAAASSTSIGWEVPSAAVPGNDSGSAMSITMPVNSTMLARHGSLPSLPQGPPHQGLSRINSQRWFRPKGSSDVTTYAEAYTRMTHHSPFATAAAGR